MMADGSGGGADHVRFEAVAEGAREADGTLALAAPRKQLPAIGALLPSTLSLSCCPPNHIALAHSVPPSISPLLTQKHMHRFAMKQHQ